MQSQISDNCHLCWGKKGGKSALGWILAFQKLSSPLIPQLKAVSFQGGVSVMQSTGLELPAGGRRRWGALLIPGLFQEQSSGTRVKSQLPARPGSTKGRGNLSKSISMHQPTASPAQGLKKNPNFRSNHISRQQGKPQLKPVGFFYNTWEGEITKNPQIEIKNTTAKQRRDS